MNNTDRLTELLKNAAFAASTQMFAPQSDEYYTWMARLLSDAGVVILDDESIAEVSATVSQHIARIMLELPSLDITEVE